MSSSYTYSNGTINGNITIDPYGMPTRRSDSAELPAIVVEGFDDVGAVVKMKLVPEANISSSDTMKILMMSIAVINGSHLFNPLAYVKKHNLERHFTYS